MELILIPQDYVLVVYDEYLGFLLKFDGKAHKFSIIFHCLGQMSVY